MPVFSLILDQIYFPDSAQEERVGQQESPEHLGHNAPGAPRTREQPYVAQGIQIDLHTKPANVLAPEPIQNLTKIRVLLPANSVELSPVVRMDCDEIAPSSMVRAQDQSMLTKQVERMNDVARGKVRAVTTDNHDFLISHPRQIFDRVHQPLAERSPLLPMNQARW